MSNIPLPHMRGLPVQQLEAGRVYLCLVSARRILVLNVEQITDATDDGVEVKKYFAHCHGWNHVKGEYDTPIVFDHQLAEIPVHVPRRTVDEGTRPTTP